MFSQCDKVLFCVVMSCQLGSVEGCVPELWPFLGSPHYVRQISINIFYCIVTSGNGVGPQVLPTLVTALPLQSFITAIYRHMIIADYREII